MLATIKNGGKWRTTMSWKAVVYRLEIKMEK